MLSSAQKKQPLNAPLLGAKSTYGGGNLSMKHIGINSTKNEKKANLKALQERIQLGLPQEFIDEGIATDQEAARSLLMESIKNNQHDIINTFTQSSTLDPDTANEAVKKVIYEILPNLLGNYFAPYNEDIKLKSAGIVLKKWLTPAIKLDSNVTKELAGILLNQKTIQRVNATSYYYEDDAKKNSDILKNFLELVFESIPTEEYTNFSQQFDKIHFNNPMDYLLNFLYRNTDSYSRRMDTNYPDLINLVITSTGGNLEPRIKIETEWVNGLDPSEAPVANISTSLNLSEEPVTYLDRCIFGCAPEQEINSRLALYSSRNIAHALTNIRSAYDPSHAKTKAMEVFGKNDSDKMPFDDAFLPLSNLQGKPKTMTALWQAIKDVKLNLEDKKKDYLENESVTINKLNESIEILSNFIDQETEGLVNSYQQINDSFKYLHKNEPENCNSDEALEQRKSLLIEASTSLLLGYAESLHGVIEKQESNGNEINLKQDNLDSLKMELEKLIEKYGERQPIALRSCKHREVFDSLFKIDLGPIEYTRDTHSLNLV